MQVRRVFELALEDVLALERGEALFGQVKDVGLLDLLSEKAGSLGQTLRET